MPQSYNTENIEIMSMTFETTIEKDGKDYPVVVEYSYTKGCRGSRDSCCGVPGAGPPLEPDEPPKVEIESVQNFPGIDILPVLTKAQVERLEEQAFEHVADQYEEIMEARAEGQMDDRRLGL